MPAKRITFEEVSKIHIPDGHLLRIRDSHTGDVSFSGKLDEGGVRVLPTLRLGWYLMSVSGPEMNDVWEFCVGDPEKIAEVMSERVGGVVTTKGLQMACQQSGCGYTTTHKASFIQHRDNHRKDIAGRKKKKEPKPLNLKTEELA